MARKRYSDEKASNKLGAVEMCQILGVGKAQIRLVTLKNKLVLR
jgi:hypothetical protein